MEFDTGFAGAVAIGHRLHDGIRIDIFISQACPDITRSSAQRLITSNSVLVNGSPVKRAHKARTGDTVVGTMKEIDALCWYWNACGTIVNCCPLLENDTGTSPGMFAGETQTTVDELSHWAGTVVLDDSSPNRHIPCFGKLYPMSDTTVPPSSEPTAGYMFTIWTGSS